MEQHGLVAGFFDELQKLGVKIHLVDGGKVKTKHDMDFVEGGHDKVYKWIPKDEIWIDKHLSPSQRPYVAFHELVERARMAKGESYDKAHVKANVAEKDMREKRAASKLRSMFHLAPMTSERERLGWPSGYTAMLGNRQIGRTILRPSKAGIPEIAREDIIPEFQGMGLGQKMRGEVMRRQSEGTLQSGGSVSPQAQSVWRKHMRTPGYHVEVNPYAKTGTREGRPYTMIDPARAAVESGKRLVGEPYTKIDPNLFTGTITRKALITGKMEKKAGEIGRARDITQDDVADFSQLPFFRFHKSWERKIVRAKNGDLVGHAAYEPETGELKGLWVHPRYRRKGVATKLIKSLSKDVTFLNVLRSNKAAKNLYTGLGFKVTGPAQTGGWRAHRERMEKKASDVLYHGSPKKLKILVPKNLHGDPDVASAVFATPSREFALPYAGGKWGDRDINQNTQFKKGVRRVILQEMRPGAFKDTFEGRKGYMYHVPEETFKPPAHRKPSTWEVISEKPVKPIKVEEILDVAKALRDAGISLLPYDLKETLKVLKRRDERTSQMTPEKQRGYYKWWLEKAPPEVAAELRKRLSS